MSSSPFYSTGGIVPIALLLLLQLLVASSVNARPSGDQALLGGDHDQPDCVSFIRNNFNAKCGEEAAIHFPGHDDPSRCRWWFELYKCQTLAACKSCTSDSLATWIQTKKNDAELEASSEECESLPNEKPTIECQATPPPPTTEPTTSTSTSTTVAPTTASGFPVWIIVVVIVAIVVLIGAITFTYFLCRKSDTPKPHKASKRMASSGTAAVATSANVRPSPTPKGKRNRSGGRGGKSRRTSQG